MWQTDSAGQLFICFSQCFSLYCVCVSVCVWLWQGSFQTLQTLMNGSLCVHMCMCVCVVKWNICTLVFSSMQNILLLKILILSLITAPSKEHTHNILSAGCRTIIIAAHTHTRVLCDSLKTLLFHLPDVPIPVMHWPWEHHQQVVHLVTHTHLQVAICSASRHATMTKYQQGSKLLWLPRLTYWQKPLNPSQIWCIGAKYYHSDFCPEVIILLLNVDHESVQGWALILPNDQNPGIAAVTGPICSSTVAKVH